MEITTPRHPEARPLPTIIDPIVRMREASRATGLSDALLYELISKGQFPKPFPLVPNGRAVGWKASTIAQWINDRSKANSKE